MSQAIVNRYPRTGDNALIIEVATSKVEDLYNNFDRHAPYILKDLDSELTDYLVNAVSEIGREKFVIHFSFDEPANPELISRVRVSVKNYFQYMKQLQKRELSRMLRTSAIFLLTGLVILFLSITSTREAIDSDSVVLHVLSEGLTVAAWVSLWQALANILINWMPHMRLWKIQDRIMHATLLFE